MCQVLATPSHTGLSQSGGEVPRIAGSMKIGSAQGEILFLHPWKSRGSREQDHLKPVLLPPVISVTTHLDTKAHPEAQTPHSSQQWASRAGADQLFCRHLQVQRESLICSKPLYSSCRWGSVRITKTNWSTQQEHRKTAQVPSEIYAIPQKFNWKMTGLHNSAELLTKTLCNCVYFG